MRYELFIALRYLRPKKGRSFISIANAFSMLGLAVGIATVIVVLSVLNGMEEIIKDKMLGAEAHILIWAQDADVFGDYERVIEEATSVKGVIAATPAVVSQALVQDESGQRRTGVIVKGIDPERENRVTNIERYLSKPLDFDPDLVEEARVRYKGRFSITGPIILGSGVAKRLGVTVGDVVVLFSKLVPDPVRAGGYIPITRSFVVVDIYDSGMYSYDSALVFLPLKVAQQIYEMAGMVSRIEVRVSDPGKVDKVRLKLLMKLGFGFMPKTWKEMHGNLFSAMQLEKRVTFVVETLIVIVAAFSITSSLIMLVMEKVRDIGILKAMGAKNGSIAKIFTFQSGVIALIGAALGTGFGLFLCWSLETWLHIPIYKDVYQLDTLPVKISWPFVVLVNISAFVICLLAALYPSRRAATLNPVEALRYE
ncbi:TPA: ABC transporter permease [Candidatus Poribacteria bacterium]|nr:ABC transporter permease [Candidatus Poribacteria bacterium]